MAQGNPQRYVVVDGTLSPDEIHALVLARLRAMGALP
jgi:dTMP kinase